MEEGKEEGEDGPDFIKRDEIKILKENPTVIKIDGEKVK
jgi:hypothetical protein